MEIIMSEINRAVKGTGDVLPSDSYKWQFVEGKMLETAQIGRAHV